MATGCAGAPRATVAFARPNVLMSNYRDVNVLATRMAGRSEWPSVSTGYVFDDVTYFSTVSVDDQAFYDQEGGGHYRSTESVQTGVRVR
jgi:hypothetical protein